MNIEITDEERILIDRYRKGIVKKLMLLAICVAGIVLVIGLLSVSVYKSITLMDAYRIIWNHIIGVTYEPRSAEWWADFYIWNRALPRICACILAGASLAVSGALMQSLMNNPLADPYSTGISSGACFGAVAAIIVGFSFSSFTGELGILSNAFIGAMIPAAIIIIMSTRIRLTPATMILVGTAISYFFNSLVTYMMVATDADTLQRAYLWQVGSLNGISWSSIPIMLMVTVAGSFIIMLLSRKLNLLSLGDNSARSLGLDVKRFRIVCLAIMAFMTCAIISYTGIIGFVGLVAPHVVRMVVGSDNKFVLPISMAVGVLLLLVADYIAVTLMNIPVGVVMSMIGSPIFFTLILWQRKSYGAIY